MFQEFQSETVSYNKFLIVRILSTRYQSQLAHDVILTLIQRFLDLNNVATMLKQRSVLILGCNFSIYFYRKVLYTFP